MNIRKIIFLSIVFSFFACNKNKQHPVPYFSFDANINLNLPSYVNLQGVGGWAYVVGIGSKGVVIYRQSQQNFVAFDRQSPAEGSLDCATGLEVDEDNFLILNDPCSNAQFSLYDGSIIGGDTEWGLRAYTVEYNGGQTVRIYNP
jgi:nitrite reductase/ring-hydroxylating ferredoxin subunit